MRKFSEKIEYEIVQEYLFNCDLTITALAEKYNCCNETITSIFDRANVSRELRKKRALNVVARKRTPRIPESAKILTQTKSWILGVLCGDAHLDRKVGRVMLESGVARVDAEFIDMWRSNLESIYSLACTPIKRRSKVFGYTLNSRAVAEDLASYGTFGSYEWHAPRRILNSTAKLKAAFLQGFFDSEGFPLKPGRCAVHATSVNKLGLEEVQQLLRELGIKSSLKQIHKKYRKCLNCRRYMSLRHEECRYCGSIKLLTITVRQFLLYIGKYPNVKNFARLVGFRLSHKQKRLKKMLEIKPKFTRDVEWMCEEIARALKCGAKTVIEVQKKTNFSGYMVRKYLPYALERK